MTKKKGRSKGGGPGGDREMEDDDASTEEETSTGVAEQLNELDTINQRVNDKAQATSPRCPHVGKAVNVPAIKKALKVRITSILFADMLYEKLNLENSVLALYVICNIF